MHVVSVGIFSPLTLLSSKLFTIRHPRFRRPSYPRIKAESLDAGVLTSSVAEARGTWGNCQRTNGQLTTTTVFLRLVLFLIDFVSSYLSSAIFLPVIRDGFNFIN